MPQAPTQLNCLPELRNGNAGSMPDRLCRDANATAVRRTLDVSSCHLSAETWAWLDAQTTDTAVRDPASRSAEILGGRTRHGWLIYAGLVPTCRHEQRANTRDPGLTATPPDQAGLLSSSTLPRRVTLTRATRLAGAHDRTQAAWGDPRHAFVIAGSARRRRSNSNAGDKVRWSRTLRPKPAVPPTPPSSVQHGSAFIVREHEASRFTVSLS